MTERIEVIVIGAGHNGLVCAATLARAGRSVLVLEAGERPGGCADTREFAPGYRASACAQWLYQLHPDIARELALERHGLRFAARDLPSVALGSSGEHLTVLGAAAEGAGFSADDRAAYAAFYHQTARYAKLLARLFEARAPRLVEGNLGDRLTLARLGLGLKLLGRQDMGEFMRVVLINMYDLLQEHFADNRLKALLGLDSVLGAHMGPRTPGTVFGYLHRRVGQVFGRRPGQGGHALVAGGMGALGQALADSAVAAGVTLRTGCAVQRIDVHGQRVLGVTLASGEQLRAPVVVSGADPVSTFACLVGFEHMETGAARRVSQVRTASGTARLHLALDGLPEFTGLPPAAAGHRLVIAPDLDYIERAFNAVKYGDCSAHPALDISIPTVHDPGLAPAGKHVLSATVQYAPHTPRGGWETQRETFLATLLDTLSLYAPRIREQVVAAQLLTPADLERDYRVTGGHWHHGELSLDQLLVMRPFPGATQYRALFDGLYLCGAGAHPGGGVMGLAGRNAAREIIRGEGN